MAQSGRRVLVSVLNYNAVDDTVATARCLQQQTYVDFDLEITDNASTNDCVARIREQMPNIAITRNPVNSGYAGGMNSILERGWAAGYAHVVVCNNDLVIPPDTVERLVAAADARTDAGVVGCVEMDYFTGKVRAVGGTGFSLWRLRCAWSIDIPAAPITQFAFAQGAMLLFTRRALEAGVFMDSDLFMYYEEADLGFKLARSGLRAYVVKDAVIRHKADERFLDLRSGYYMQRNRVYLARKYGRWYHLAWHAMYASLFELPMKAVVRGAQGHSRYAMACVRGFRDGLAGRMGMRKVV